MDEVWYLVLLLEVAVPVAGLVAVAVDVLLAGVEAVVTAFPVPLLAPDVVCALLLPAPLPVVSCPVAPLFCDEPAACTLPLSGAVGEAGTTAGALEDVAGDDDWLATAACPPCVCAGLLPLLAALSWAGSAWVGADWVWAGCAGVAATPLEPEAGVVVVPC